MNPNAIDVLLEELTTATKTIQDLTHLLTATPPANGGLWLIYESETVLGAYVGKLKVAELTRVKPDLPREPAYEVTLGFNQPLPPAVQGPVSLAQALAFLMAQAAPAQ